MSGAIGPHCVTANFTTYITPWGPTVTINKAILERFQAACEEAHETHPWKPLRIDSYNCRQIRGSSSWSRHAYAAAFDMFDKPYPQPVDVWGPGNAPPASFAAIFVKYGFTWGGVWSRKDYPHIEWSGDTVPPLEVKEFDELASEEDIRRVVREAMADFSRLLAVGKSQPSYDSDRINLRKLL